MKTYQEVIMFYINMYKTFGNSKGKLHLACDSLLYLIIGDETDEETALLFQTSHILFCIVTNLPQRLEKEDVELLKSTVNYEIIDGKFVFN